MAFPVPGNTNLRGTIGFCHELFGGQFFIWIDVPASLHGTPLDSSKAGGTRFFLDDPNRVFGKHFGELQPNTPVLFDVVAGTETNGALWNHKTNSWTFAAVNVRKA